MKGIKRFGRKGKFSPRFVGPYEILSKVGPVAYQLALPLEWEGMHDVFHVSMLRKYVANPSHVLDYTLLSMGENLSYIEQLVQIMDRKEQILPNKKISLVKVLWRSQEVEEASWELESEMREKYPHLFTDLGYDLA